MSPKFTWFFVILLSALMGSFGGYFATTRVLEEPLHKLSLTTPVFVLDRTALVKAIPPEASPDAIARAMDAWRQQADQLARAGYLVIDAGMVVSAPEDVYVRTQE